MFCKTCGCNLSDTALFCNNCGSKIERTLSKGEPAENKSVNQKKGKRRLMNFLLCLLEILALLGSDVSMLLVMAAFSITIPDEETALSVAKGIATALLASATILPILFWVLFCGAIIYVCIKRNTKFLIKYILPCVIITGAGTISAITGNEEFSIENILRAVIPIALAVVVKAIVNARKKKNPGI